MQPSSSWQRYLEATERFVETLIFASRWLLAPFYIGLCISIVVLLIKFMAELFHLLHEAFSMTEPEVIVGVLSLVDMALTGSLLIIVIFSGYENFVSRINHEGHQDWPAWMGTIDFSALKLKLLSSIVAISAIQLLKQFMALDKVSDRDLYFLIIIHVVFVVSSVFLALSDRISGHEAHGDHGPGHGEGGSHPKGGTNAGSQPGRAGGEQEWTTGTVALSADQRPAVAPEASASLSSHAEPAATGKPQAGQPRKGSKP